MSVLRILADPMGSKTTYSYDALDNIAKVTDALKQVSEYTNGDMVSYTYDALGRKAGMTYLEARDIMYEANPQKFEKLISCPKCDAKNYLLLNKKM